VASLVLTLSVLVCLLSLTGHSVASMLRDIREIVIGG
jgi:hypothetical protein